MQVFKHSEWLCWTYFTCVFVLHRYFCTQGAMELPLSVCAIKLDVIIQVAAVNKPSLTNFN